MQCKPLGGGWIVPRLVRTRKNVHCRPGSHDRFGASTQLYGLDSNSDTLVTQANGAGTLVTVGAAGIDFGSRASFDILGSDAFAYAGSTLYRVDLATGAFTSLGGTDRALFGIAIAAVPEPATWGMMILGFGLMGGAMRRRTTKVAYA